VTQQPAATVHWETAVGTGLVRVGAGVALWRWRDPLIKLAGGSPKDPVLRSVFTYFAVRDLALGVSALLATRPDANVPRQVAYQGVADTVDTAIVAGLVSSGRLTRVKGTGAAALAALTALSEYATAWRLRRLAY